MRLIDGKVLVTMDTEIPYTGALPTLFHLGTEWKPIPIVAFRGGAGQQINNISSGMSTTNLTLGVGLDYEGFKIDYAYHPYYTSFSDSITSTVSITYVDPFALNVEARVDKDVVGSGDLQIVRVRTPKDSRKVRVVMPDSEEIELKYEPDKDEWVGGWWVPGKFAGRGFVGKAFLTDWDYNVWRADTNPFEIVSKGNIDLISPADKSIVYTKEILVKGNILSGRVDTILIQGKKANIVGDRVFSLKIPLELGKNPIMVQALDMNGRVLQQLKVRVLRLQTFRDVPENYWAKLSIEQLATLGIITGYPDGTFRPNGTITRAELTTLIVRVIGREASGLGVQLFSDVRPQHWAFKYIDLGVEERIVTGYPDGTFRPEIPVNRVEGVSIITRFSRLPEYSENVVYYRDMRPGHWAFNTISAAHKGGLLTHLDEYFGPKDELSRGEAAGILARTRQVSQKVDELMSFEIGYFWGDRSYVEKVEIAKPVVAPVVATTTTRVTTTTTRVTTTTTRVTTTTTRVTTTTTLTTTSTTTTTTTQPRIERPRTTATTTLPKKKYVYHYVSVGDSLAKISTRYYGDATYADEIAELNNLASPRDIFTLEYLKIDPDLASGREVEEEVEVEVETPAVPRVPTAPLAPRTPAPIIEGEKRVVYHYISVGESLEIIAEKYYGDRAKWREIAEMNDITTPEDIKAGKYLRIELPPEE
jgi:nucleoid-associated protein YgaU